MGFVFSVLYFVVYYLTPATVFGPLAEFHIELILAVLLIGLSVPKLAGSIVLKTPQSLALIALTFAVFLSVLIAARWVSGAFAAWLAFIPAIFAYFLVCLHCATKKRMQIMVFFLLLSCLFVMANGYSETMHGVPDTAANQQALSVSSYALVQNGADGLIYRIRGLGEIHDPNDFGQLLVCVTPLIFFFWKPKSSFRNFFFVLLPVSALLFGTYLTHSRGALLALMAILIVSSRRRIGLLPALVLGAGVFAASMALHFSGGRDISAEAGADRTALWGTGLQILKAHPLFGVGIGAFSDNCDGCGHTAHNSLVVCAAETGLFGLFFWCFFLFAAIRNVLVIASPQKVSETDPIQTDEETFSQAGIKLEAIDKAEINRLGSLLLLSLTGFCVSGWFLSRAYILTLFLLGGLVEVVYEMALRRGMVAPRLPIARTALYSAGLAAALVLLMYVLLRTVNLMH